MSTIGYFADDPGVAAASRGGAAQRLRRVAASAVAGFHTLHRRSRPEHWLATVLVLLLIGFFLAMVLEPGAVGRGGR